MSEESGVSVTFDEVAAIEKLIGLGMILQAVVFGGPDLLAASILDPVAVRRMVGDCDRATKRLRDSARP